MSRPAPRPFTAPAAIDTTTGFLLRKIFGARLDPDETMLGRPRDRA
jgi:hypothetical protein